jgi:predicted ATPase
MLPDEQVLARRLCVLRGFTFDAVDLIGAYGASSNIANLDLLQRLVDVSIVQVDHSKKEPRYRFLESVREFLLEKLIEAAEENTVRSAHLSHYYCLCGISSGASDTGRRN